MSFNDSIVNHSLHKIHFSVCRDSRGIYEITSLACPELKAKGTSIDNALDVLAEMLRKHEPYRNMIIHA